MDTWQQGGRLEYSVMVICDSGDGEWRIVVSGEKWWKVVSGKVVIAGRWKEWRTSSRERKEVRGRERIEVSGRERIEVSGREWIEVRGREWWEW